MRNPPIALLIVVLGCGPSQNAIGDDGGPDGSTDDGGSGTGDGGGSGGPSTNLDINRSGTRIKMRVGTTPDGARTFLGWRDVQRGDNCNFLAAADGQQRCIPVGVSASLFFRDAGCTQPLGAAALGNCPAPPLPRYATKIESTCSGVGPAGHWRVYSITGAYTGPRYTGTPTNCTVSNLTGYEAYALGMEIPPSEFAGLTETLE